MFLLDILLPFRPVPLDYEVMLKFNDPVGGIAKPPEFPRGPCARLPSLSRVNSVLVLPAVALLVLISLYSLVIKSLLPYGPDEPLPMRLLSCSL